MKKGYIVVHKTGKDKMLYTIAKVDGDVIHLNSDVSSPKVADVSQLREATDIEIMLGRRN